MKRKSLENAECPVARSLETVGDTWSVLIVREAFAGKRRFGEFEKGLGVAKNILTTRLRKLVALRVFGCNSRTDSTPATLPADTDVFDFFRRGGHGAEDRTRG